MRVIIGEDETLLRAGLALVLARGGWTVVSAVGDAASLIRDACELQPDLVVTDIRMPPRHRDEGLRAALAIRTYRPRIGMVVLSQHLQRGVAAELLASFPAGPVPPSAVPAGTGYLLKQRISDVDGFHRDLRRVHTGETVLDPEVVNLMVAAKARSAHDPVARLSGRQQEVLALMAEGMSNAAIARKLSVTERAVVQHCSNIYFQLGLQPSDDEHRRVVAVLRYLASQA